MILQECCGVSRCLFNVAESCCSLEMIRLKLVVAFWVSLYLQYTGNKILIGIPRLPYHGSRRNMDLYNNNDSDSDSDRDGIVMVMTMMVMTMMVMTMMMMMMMMMIIIIILTITITTT